MRPGHPSPCPTWCRADHEADERRRLESVRATARQLAAEGLQVEPVLDTFRVHRVDVGQVVVRAGAAEEPAALRGWSCSSSRLGRLFAAARDSPAVPWTQVASAHEGGQV